MPTIDDFICQRLLDARSKLETIDASFVKSIESAQNLSLKGIQIHKIEPSWRLPKKWTSLLEICADIAREVEQLHLITESLDPKNFAGRQAGEIGREGTRHLFDWVIHEQALIEKVKLLIIRTIDVSFTPPNQELKKSILTKYKERIWKGVERRFSSARHALVHGAGSKCTVYRAISEEKSWEGIIALEVPMDSLVSSTWAATSKFLNQWREENISQTSKLLQSLGNVLGELNTELAARREISGHTG